jgi:hypothetical protein
MSPPHLNNIRNVRKARNAGVQRGIFDIPEVSDVIWYFGARKL